MSADKKQRVDTLEEAAARILSSVKHAGNFGRLPFSIQLDLLKYIGFSDSRALQGTARLFVLPEKLRPRTNVLPFDPHHCRVHTLKS